MAKSYLSPGVVMTRLEKKKLHKEKAHSVYPKGRRKYSNVLYRLRPALWRDLVTDQRPVEWTDIANKPETLPCVEHLRVPILDPLTGYKLDPTN